LSNKKKNSIWANIGMDFFYAKLPFVFFAGFLAILYIANSHYAEKKVREIQSLQKELQNEKWRYMAIEADIMYSTTQSQLNDGVVKAGLEKPKEAPYKFELFDDEEK